MMKKIFLLIIVVSFLQSCFVKVQRDYDVYGKTLLFNQNKKWLVNKVYTDLSASQDKKMDQKVLKTFNELSKGNAISVDSAKSQNLMASKISFAPDPEQLQSLKDNTDFDFIVNIRTKKIRDQIGSLELEKPLQYSVNSAFALLEIYDIKTLKKVYSQKAFSEMSLDKKETFNISNSGEISAAKKKNGDSGPYFSYSADMLSVKNLNKILKDIKKHAIK